MQSDTNKDSGTTKTVDLVAVFDAAYEPEWERVAEQDDSASASGEADRMATAAGIRAVLAALPPEPEGCIWVLTRSINDYNQDGEYFATAWTHKPTIQNLLDAQIPAGLVEHVLAGGGRVKFEYEWFHLREIILAPAQPETKDGK